MLSPGNIPGLGKIIQKNNTAQLCVRVLGVSVIKLDLIEYKNGDNTYLSFNQLTISSKMTPSVFVGWLKPGVSTKTTSRP
jgi:hypothetical protein